VPSFDYTAAVLTDDTRDVKCLFGASELVLNVYFRFLNKVYVFAELSIAKSCVS
jgi:hypothetical protein